MALKIELTTWSTQAAEWLQKSNVNFDVENIKAQVVEDGASVYKVMRDQVLVGFFVTRIDSLKTHDEGVLVAATGFDNQADLTKTILPEIENKIFSGCKSVRIHTARPGLIKKLSSGGYKPLEFVMTKDF